MMDLLGKYQEQLSPAEEKRSAMALFDEDSDEAGFIVKFVMRASRGLIQTERQARIALGVVAVLFLILSIYIVAGSSFGGVQEKFISPPKQRNF